MYSTLPRIHSSSSSTPSPSTSGATGATVASVASGHRPSFMAQLMADQPSSLCPSPASSIYSGSRGGGGAGGGAGGGVPELTEVLDEPVEEQVRHLCSIHSNHVVGDGWHWPFDSRPDESSRCPTGQEIASIHATALHSSVKHPANSPLPPGPSLLLILAQLASL